MLANSVKLALITTALALFTTFIPTNADAQRIHSRCAKAKDKVKCTCGVENGATFRAIPGGRRRMIIREGNAAVNDGYARCLMRHGRS
jgi:hypothetical protein